MDEIDLDDARSGGGLAKNMPSRDKLREQIASDPDLPCEAGVPPVANVREALEKLIDRFDYLAGDTDPPTDPNDDWDEHYPYHYVVWALNNALETLTTPVWRDMESAPRDGSRVLLFIPPYGATTGHWEETRWLGHSVIDRGASPSAWLPLPPPPTQEPNDA